MAKILVVDDCPTVINFLSKLFATDGHVVETLDSFVQLPLYLRKASPDLVVLDLDMPTMNGIAFGRFIRQQQRKPIPIMLFSAQSEQKRSEASVEIGASHLCKSETPHAIRRRVNRMIELGF